MHAVMSHSVKYALRSLLIALAISATTVGSYFGIEHYRHYVKHQAALRGLQQMGLGFGRGFSAAKNYRN